MQERDCWIDRALFELIVLEGDAHELPVQGKGESSVVHVEEASQDALLPESFAILVSRGI